MNQKWLYLSLCLTASIITIQAQTPTEIRFRLFNASLRQAVEQLIADHDLSIVYQSRQLRGKRVTAECDPCTPDQALGRLLFAVGLTWRKVGDQFILIQANGRVNGSILLEGTDLALGGVAIHLYRKMEGDEDEALFIERQISSATGRFDFRNLVPGDYALIIRSENFLEAGQLVEQLTLDEVREVFFELEQKGLDLEEYTVRPSNYDLRNQAEFNLQRFDRETLTRLPRFGDDVYRALENLPGISTADLNADFRIRGGRTNETLILFDGVELDEPFHLKDAFSGLFSILDDPIVGDVRLGTGGTPINYGHKMSGIFDIRSRRPEGEQTLFGATTLALRFKDEGLIQDGRGAYQLAVRDGFFNEDIILTEFTESVSDNNTRSNVDFQDVFGKISYQLTDRHSLEVNALYAEDDAEVDERRNTGPESSRIVTKGGNETYWLRFTSFWSSALTSETTLFSGVFDRNTQALDGLGSRRYTIDEAREHRRWGVRQDWNYLWENRHLFKAGFEWRSSSFDVRYRNTKEDLGTLILGNLDPVNVEVEEDTKRYGIYVADRWRVTESITAEAGLRYDAQTHTDDSHLSPRLSLSYLDDPVQEFKFGWGVYYQPQALYDIQVEDGVSEYQAAEKATHWILGYQRRFLTGFDLRTEIYRKEYDDLRDRYINFLDPNNSFPETQGDRTLLLLEDGQAQGVELSVRHQINSSIGWTANYALSEVYENTSDGRVFRQWDQQHAVNLGLDYRVDDIWSINIAWHYHTGWRTTDIGAQLTKRANGESIITPDIGPLNEGNFPEYHRMDVRYQRRFLRTRKHALTIYAEVTNLYNRRNIQNYGDHRAVLGEDDRLSISFDDDIWIPQIANIGLTWKMY